MIQHEFSYWLHVKPGPNADLSDLTRIQAAMTDTGLLCPQGSLVCNIDQSDHTLSAEIDPSTGTVPEDPEIQTSIANLALIFSDFIFSLSELDEEDKSNQIYTEWSNGVQTIQRRARLIPADELYDTMTVRDIIAFLRAKRVPDAVLDSLAGQFLSL